MTLTNAEWADIEEALSGFVGQVRLDINGSNVLLHRGKSGKNQMNITVYVNDSIDMSMRKNNAGFVEKIWHRRVVGLYSAKEKAIYGKWSAKKRKDYGLDLNKKHEYFVPYFSSFRTLKNQYKKLESISIVSITKGF